MPSLADISIGVVLTIGVVLILLRSKLITPGPHSPRAERWSESCARAQMLWGESYRGSEHRLGILRTECMNCVLV